MNEIELKIKEIESAIKEKSERFSTTYDQLDILVILKQITSVLADLSKKN